MADAGDFAMQLENRLTGSDRARTARLEELVAAMEAHDEGIRTFEEVADPLYRTVIRPCVEQLAAHFPNATVEHFRTKTGFFSTGRFERSERFPATVTLTVGLECHPGDCDEYEAVYRLSVVPLLFDLDPVDHLSVELDTPELAVRCWVEGRLLAFLDVYLRIENDPNYHVGSIKQAPVCGMMLSAPMLPHRQTVGKKTYYFCLEGCLRRFQAEPSLFVPGTSIASVCSAPEQASPVASPRSDQNV